MGRYLTGPCESRAGDQKTSRPGRPRNVNPAVPGYCIDQGLEAMLTGCTPVGSSSGFRPSVLAAKIAALHDVLVAVCVSLSTSGRKTVRKLLVVRGMIRCTCFGYIWSDNKRRQLDQ